MAKRGWTIATDAGAAKTVPTRERDCMMPLFGLGSYGKPKRRYSGLAQTVLPAQDGLGIGLWGMDSREHC